jgi:hypothetical protein
MLRDILNMDWPAALAIATVCICLTVNWNIRRMTKLEAQSKREDSAA